MPVTDRIQPPGTGRSRLSAQHLPFLDGIRGMAILLVMFHHMTVLYPKSAAEQYLYQLSLFGPHGVDLFFVLSGFLITGILLDTRSSPNFFRNFYARRTLRIFPLYYILVAFSFLILPWCIEQFPRYAYKLARFATVSNEWPWYFLYGSNYVVAYNNGWRHGILDVSWSLSIEEQYYLAWAVAVYFLSRRRLQVISISILVILPFLRAALLAKGVSPLMVYVLTPTRLDGISWGGLIALAVRDDGWLYPFLQRVIKPVGCIAAVVVLVPLVLGKWDYMGVPELGFGYSAVAALFAAMLWVTYHRDGILRRIFEQKWLRFFGVYSYSIYLFHLPLRAAIRDTVFGDPQFRALASSAIPGQLIFYCVATLAVIPLSLLSWYLLEQPFLRLKKKFMPAPVPMVSAAPI
jgi:peptidoglycan/LPS O-acetylase OafA/YrhL